MDKRAGDITFTDHSKSGKQNFGEACELFIARLPVTDGNFPQSHRKGAQAKVPDYRTVGRSLDPIWSTGYVSEAVDTVTRPVTSVDVLRVSTPEPESAILSGRVVR